MNKLIFVLTTNCNLKCNYCLIKKNNNKTDKNIIKKTLDLFLQTRGNKKYFKIFGGEPLIYFGLVKFTILHGLKLAQKYKKKIKFEITTNGKLSDTEKLNFFQKYQKQIQLTLSCDLENKNFDKKNKKIDLKQKILKKIDLKNTVITCVVSPKTTDLLLLNFKHLLKLGFYKFNILPVYFSQLWDKRSLKKLEKEFLKILKLKKEITFTLEGFAGQKQEKTLFNTDLTINYNGDIFTNDSFLIFDKNVKKYLM